MAAADASLLYTTVAAPSDAPVPAAPATPPGTFPGPPELSRDTDGLLEFDIPILVPDTERWQSVKSPPKNGSIIGVHGVLLGYDSNAKWIRLSLQDIDYVPQDKSAPLETSSP